MTTWELDKLIYDFIVKHGGTPNFKGLYGFCLLYTSITLANSVKA